MAMDFGGSVHVAVSNSTHESSVFLYNADEEKCRRGHVEKMCAYALPCFDAWELSWRCIRALHLMPLF